MERMCGSRLAKQFTICATFEAQRSTSSMLELRFPFSAERLCSRAPIVYGKRAPDDSSSVRRTEVTKRFLCRKEKRNVLQQDHGA